MEKKKRDVLTQHVLDYNNNPTDENFIKITRKAYNLIEKVLRYYSMHNFPKIYVEEVRDNCRTIVLLQSIRNYNPDKGAFSTHYVWKIKSHVNCERRKLLRRSDLLNSYNIDTYLDTAYSDDIIEISRQINNYSANFYNRRERVYHDLCKKGR